MRLRRKKRIVLILGAGGSRGIAHLGVLRALIEEGVPFDCIANFFAYSYPQSSDAKPVLFEDDGKVPCAISLP